MIRTPKVTGSPDEIWLTYGRTGADDDGEPGLQVVREPLTPDDVRYVRAPRARPRTTHPTLPASYLAQLRRA